MDWAGLQAFVAVADHGGFSAAASQLHLTQPAVSKRIALLEQSLDARLFDRLGRQVVLTEAGAGKKNAALAAGIAAVQRHGSGLEKLQQGIQHGRIDFRAVPPGGDPDNVVDQSEHGGRGSFFQLQIIALRRLGLPAGGATQSLFGLADRSL